MATFGGFPFPGESKSTIQVMMSGTSMERSFSVWEFSPTFSSSRP
jgi:hypothetical protein